LDDLTVKLETYKSESEEINATSINIYSQSSERVDRTRYAYGNFVVIVSKLTKVYHFDPPPVDLVLPQPPLDDVFDVSLPPPPVIDPEAIDPKDIPEANELTL
jgi:hypothetical protein